MPNIPTVLIPVFVFLWAFADSAFPISLFVPGEPVFLYVGYQLSENIGFELVIAALLGGFFSDQTSYWIGNRYGFSVLRRIKGKKKRRHIARMRWALRRYGALCVVLARVLGPVAWVTPVLCGSIKLSYSRFFLASMLGCCVGIGQFIALGYLSRKGIELINFDRVVDFTSQNATALLLFTGFIIVFSGFIILIRRTMRSAAKNKEILDVSKEFST